MGALMRTCHQMVSLPTDNKPSDTFKCTEVTEQKNTNCSRLILEKCFGTGSAGQALFGERLISAFPRLKGATMTSQTM